MSNMTNELRIRIITASLGAPLLLYLIHVGGAAFFVGMGALSCAAFWEAFELFRKKGMRCNLFFSYTAGILVLISAFLGFPHPWYLAAATVLFAATAAYHMTREGAQGTVTAFITPGIILYCFGFPSFIIALRSLDYGRGLTYFLFLVIWGADTAAYFGGLAFGRKKLAPNVSPNKTIEGAVSSIFAGGVLGAIIFLILGLRMGSHIFPVGGYAGLCWTGGVFGMVTAIAGIFGDLVESALKRFAGVKDAGNILPGHGGVLDRFDSLFFAAPFVFFMRFLL
jgi:phosphatidate cytidylyltransferase